MSNLQQKFSIPSSSVITWFNRFIANNSKKPKIDTKLEYIQNYKRHVQTIHFKLMHLFYNNSKNKTK